MWTDSMITLHWVKSKANHWEPFVENRVREIQTLTDPSQWNHCPGNDNPANARTSGMTVGKMRDREQWWTGPNWLKER